MSNLKESWFITERSEALAGLLLTSLENVSIQKKYEQDDGVDFLVAIDNSEEPPTRLFAVQVKGTLSDQSTWMRTVNHLFRGNGQSASIPACVLVVNVRDNCVWYAWTAEPVVEPQGPALRLHQTGEFQRLDTTVVAEIIDRIKAWYDSVPKQIQSV